MDWPGHLLFGLTIPSMSCADEPKMLAPSWSPRCETCGWEYSRLPVYMCPLTSLIQNILGLAGLGCELLISLDSYCTGQVLIAV